MHNVLLGCQNPEATQNERMGEHGAAPYLESNIDGKAKRISELLANHQTVLKDHIQTTTDRHAIRI